MRLSQRFRLIALLERRGMARLSEIRAEGISAATVCRLEREGVVSRLGRGLYRRSDAEFDIHHTLAEAAKRAPRGVIALVSALSFHEITDQLPHQVWMAIGRKDWRPTADYPRLRIARFPDALLRDGVEHHMIEGVSVPIFGAAKTVVDVFRYRHKIGLDVSLQALKRALRHRKARPAEIADGAMRAGVWTTMRPYLEALVADG